MLSCRSCDVFLFLARVIFEIFGRVPAPGDLCAGRFSTRSGRSGRENHAASSQLQPLDCRTSPGRSCVDCNGRHFLTVLGQIRTEQTHCASVSVDSLRAQMSIIHARGLPRFQFTAFSSFLLEIRILSKIE